MTLVINSKKFALPFAVTVYGARSDENEIGEEN
jgi:hypothetical protein